MNKLIERGWLNPAGCRLKQSLNTQINYITLSNEKVITLDRTI